ncbi:Na+/H+ antiporter NhaA, partial [Capnocytophaga granulosa]|uniref:Na+/H+ antiporter NhaA n=1 Tax=Capnocytophaga granulosa TaxID=45242 RepID=UPI003C750F29
MKLITILKEFFLKNQSSGVLLILCVVLSLAIANSPMAEGFQALLDQEVGPYSVSMWINDALMAIFFLLVGLEIKREILKGELSDIRSASLPIVAAIGGMIVPAVIFSLLNYGTPYSKGWAIPMATDIAFS